MAGSYKIRIATSLRDIDKNQWDRLSGASRAISSKHYNPFISYDFLASLEFSGSATAQTGWLAQHILLEDEDGTLLGAIVAYAKSHSQGEYVFDHGWAEAFERAGGRYYPKLQCCVPFTPATGPRLLVNADYDPKVIWPLLADALKGHLDRTGTSSAHVTFLKEEEQSFLQTAGFLPRLDQQFHFHNQDYGSYDDFLDTLASRKRKALKKERRIALENGISIDWLTGSDITEGIWDEFFAFYLDTGGRKWGRPYLTRSFYALIGEKMADDILLVMAKRDGRYIAGAINFIGSDRLYGRHWGCVEEHPYLHFEVCYHQAIDFAIKHGLEVVEAGAQGEHKLARGYLPVITRSAHFIVHPGLRRAVADYLARERENVQEFGEILSEHSPFRKNMPERTNEEM